MYTKFIKYTVLLKINPLYHLAFLYPSLAFLHLLRSIKMVQSFIITMATTVGMMHLIFLLYNILFTELFMYSNQSIERKEG